MIGKDWLKPTSSSPRTRGPVYGLIACTTPAGQYLLASFVGTRIAFEGKAGWARWGDAPMQCRRAPLCRFTISVSVGLGCVARERSTRIVDLMLAKPQLRGQALGIFVCCPCDSDSAIRDACDGGLDLGVDCVSWRQWSNVRFSSVVAWISTTFRFLRVDGNGCLHMFHFALSVDRRETSLRVLDKRVCSALPFRT